MTTEADGKDSMFWIIDRKKNIGIEVISTGNPEMDLIFPWMGVFNPSLVKEDFDPDIEKKLKQLNLKEEEIKK